MLFSATTPGSTAVTANGGGNRDVRRGDVESQRACVLGRDRYGDRANARPRSAISSNTVAPSKTIVKDIVAPLTAVGSLLGGPPAGLGARVYGNAECGATVSIARVAGGAPVVTIVNPPGPG